jgi:hypothetical protein
MSPSTRRPVTTGILGACTALVALVALVTSCSSASHSDPGKDAGQPLLGPTAIPPYVQPAGDPARGYSLLVNAGYLSHGVPWSASRRP